MSRFLNQNTTVSKGVKVLLWSGASALVVAVLAAVVDNPNLFTPIAVVVANTLLVAARNFFRRDIKNW